MVTTGLERKRTTWPDKCAPMAKSETDMIISQENDCFDKKAGSLDNALRDQMHENKGKFHRYLYICCHLHLLGSICCIRNLSSLRRRHD